MTPLINPVEDVSRVRRPGTVTAAAVLIGVVVAAALAGLAFMWLYYFQYDGWITTAARLSQAAPADVDHERQYSLIAVIIVSAVFLGVALWFGIPLRGVLRGGKAARMFTVIGGFAGPGVVLAFFLVSCVLGGALIALIGASGGFDPGPTDDYGSDPGPVFDSPFQARLSALQETSNSWDSGAGAAAAVILTAMLAAAILLVVRPSNRFYNPLGKIPVRPAATAFYGYGYPVATYPGQPHPGQPYPGQPYPGLAYPGQPYPGQPYPGQAYPGQAYPGYPYPQQAYGPPVPPTATVPENPPAIVPENPPATGTENPPAAGDTWLPPVA